MVDRLDDLRALEAAATPGPWQWLDGGSGSGSDDDGDELQDGNGEMVATGFRDDVVPDITDGRLCAASRNALPALLDVAEAARAAIKGCDICGADRFGFCAAHEDIADALRRLEDPS